MHLVAFEMFKKIFRGYTPDHFYRRGAPAPIPVWPQKSCPFVRASSTHVARRWDYRRNYLLATNIFTWHFYFIWD